MQKYALLLLVLVSGCSSAPSCGDPETIELVQDQVKQSVRRYTSQYLADQDFEIAWNAARPTITVPMAQAYAKEIGRVTCAGGLSIQTPAPAQIVWKYPAVDQELRDRFPPGEEHRTPAVSPSDLTNASIKYSIQMVEGDSTRVEIDEGSATLLKLLGALIDGRAFAPRLIALEEPSPRDVAASQLFLAKIAAAMDRGAFVEAVKPRLKTIVGDQLATLERNLSVTSGPDLNGDYVVVFGNAPHLGDVESAAVAVSTQSGAVTAALQAGGKYHFFGVPRAQDLPWPLYQWLRASNSDGEPLSDLNVDAHLCEKIGTILQNDDLRSQADPLGQPSVVVCDGRGGCTYGPHQRQSLRTIQVSGFPSRVSDVIEYASAYFVDLNNDYVNDVWVAGRQGNTSCEFSIPLTGKRKDARSNTEDRYAVLYRFDEASAEGECDGRLATFFVRYKNYVFSVLDESPTKGLQPMIRLGTPDGFKTCPALQGGNAKGD